jgi:hypothetical protein
MKAAVIGLRLSYFEISQPESGSPKSELIGMHSNIVPSSASLKPKSVFIVGILDAHVEKQTPERKKNTLRKIRSFSFDSVATPPGYPSDTNVVRRLKNIQLFLPLKFDSV